jgi:hypothetical protein
MANSNDVLRFSFAVRFTYVLIIEWLGPDDERTGTKLLHCLDGIGVPARVANCKSSEDVQTALIHARQLIPKLGVPAIHIESHGSDVPDDPNGPEPRFGNGGEDTLTWSSLGDLLAPLNEASGFRLLFVSAACFGQAVVAAMNVGRHTAPFAAVVGFTTKVASASVRESMMELYLNLLHRNVGFDEAIESARRELYNVGEKLESDTALKLAYQMIAGTLAELREDREKRGFPAVEVDRLLSIGLTRSLEIWNTWFPPALQARDSIYRPNLELLVPPSQRA